MKGSLLLAALLSAIFANAQPAVKIYGYSQEFVPGMIRQDDIPDENTGEKVKYPRTRIMYHIYISTSASVTILPAQIWIGGKWDTISSNQIVTTPVTAEYPEKKILVPATKHTVRQLSIGDTLRKPVTLTASLKKMMKQNEVIIAYKWKGKKYFAVLKKLTVLAAVHGV